MANTKAVSRSAGKKPAASVPSEKKVVKMPAAAVKPKKSEVPPWETAVKTKKEAVPAKKLLTAPSQEAVSDKKTIGATKPPAKKLVVEKKLEKKTETKTLPVAALFGKSLIGKTTKSVKLDGVDVKRGTKLLTFHTATSDLQIHHSKNNGVEVVSVTSPTTENKLAKFPVQNAPVPSRENVGKRVSLATVSSVLQNTKNVAASPLIGFRTR